jgi:probable F420-dependent oxidoreductase
MKLGVMALCTDETMPPIDLAKAVEERGLSSLFLPEHTHIPTSRTTPYPGGEPLAQEFRRLVDPIVTLAAMAAATTTLELGTGVLLVGQHDPIVLAKQIATLDHLSKGRFVLGIGFGWNEDEMTHHGVDPKHRRSVVREKVLAMKQLWTEVEGSFVGEHVAFSSSWSWPKPVTQPHPPILIGGGAGPGLFRHIAEYASGWIPIGGAQLWASLPDLHRAAEGVGRDPATIEIDIFGARPVRKNLERYVELGVKRVVLGLPPAARFGDIRGGTKEQVLPFLDDYAALATDFEPRAQKSGITPAPLTSLRCGTTRSQYTPTTRDNTTTPQTRPERAPDVLADAEEQ